MEACYVLGISEENLDKILEESCLQPSDDPSLIGVELSNAQLNWDFEA